MSNVFQRRITNIVCIFPLLLALSRIPIHLFRITTENVGKPKNESNNKIISVGFLYFKQ